MRVYSVRLTVLRLTLLLYVGLLGYGSLAPGGAAAAGGLPGPLLHLLAYIGLGLLSAVAFPRSFDRSRLRVLSYAALLGIVLELGQLFVPARDLSGLDLGMNVVGVGLVWFLPYVRGLVSGEDEGEEEPAEPVIEGGPATAGQEAQGQGQGGRAGAGRQGER